jgi:hypothetical protein
VNIL